MPSLSRSARALVALALLAALPACDSGGPDAPPADTLRPLVLADLLAPATPAEVDAVRADWRSRDTRARDVRVEAEGETRLGTIPVRFTVLSHTVGGVRHVGAVLVPVSLPASARVPVLVYAHGGYSGPGGAPYDAGSFPAQFLGAAERLVYVVPAYRSERLSVNGRVFTAEGDPSIGNYDVDDTMALLSAALDRTPQADGSRVGVLGESRGGLVALELGARDRRVKLVLDAFGPTDVRIAYSPAILSEQQFGDAIRAAMTAPNDFNNLITSAILPPDAVTANADGSLSITEAGYREMRLRLARTAPTAYVVDLPTTEVHHGVIDPIATVEFSRALARAFAAAGRPSGSGTFTYYEYPLGLHSLFTLLDVAPRLNGAIVRVLAP